MFLMTAGSERRDASMLLVNFAEYKGAVIVVSKHLFAVSSSKATGDVGGRGLMVSVISPSQ